jgi:hypothetical protein
MANETTFTLSNIPESLKTVKAQKVIIGGNTEEVTSWKAIYTAVLKDCLTSCKDKLMGLRGDIMGKKKAILAETKDGMHSPVELASDLFAETCFDSNNTLVNLKKILDAVGYDYDEVSISVVERTK